MLAAQNGNGVTIANLAVRAGSPTTVTFDVSWNKTPMPTVWSDTVWVWVDYNKNGVMERLPMLSGATLTTTSAPGVGKLIAVSGNNKGVWVVGNARGTGSFSATVRLLTSIADVAGACAYASNYPPAAEYASNDKIEFTGTSPYDIQLAKPDGGSVTVKAGDTFLLPCNYTVTSFTDATGTPGVIDESGALPSCTAPGSTVNFTEFSPCSYAVTGNYWYLTDTREAAYGNTQTYKVKKMVDGHIWMVQDLKFGNKCVNKTTYTGSSGQDLTGNISALTDKTYYGDCRNNTVSGAGYYYDWAAAINKPGAYYQASSTVGCSGTGNSANACQGICPVGWHLPTGGDSGELTILANTPGFCVSTSVCWLAGSNFEGVPSGHLHYGGQQYWMDEMMLHVSTDCTGHSMWEIRLQQSTWSQRCPTQAGIVEKFQGEVVRCVKNYE
jgi:uncharacterized protein (TIGR02145 family)